jgi:hypothetical protein
MLWIQMEQQKWQRASTLVGLMDGEAPFLGATEKGSHAFVLFGYEHVRANVCVDYNWSVGGK